VKTIISAYGDPLGTAKTHTKIPTGSITCKVDGCPDESTCMGFCDKHYAINYRRPGETHSLVASKGSGWVDKKGYHRIKINGVTHMKHRIAWETAHGPLLPGQNLHHKNGNRADNSLENLELWDTSHPSGQRPEDLVKYAKEILARYEPRQ